MGDWSKTSGVIQDVLNTALVENGHHASPSFHSMCVRDGSPHAARKSRLPACRYLLLQLQLLTALSTQHN